MSTRKTALAVAVVTRKPPRKKARVSLIRPPRSGLVESGFYSVHPGVAMIQKWIAELKGKTGRTLDQWIAHIQAAGPREEMACRAWLKEKYGLGTNSAWWLAEKTFGNRLGLADDSPESYLAACPEYVNQMYAGSKAALRPLHDELVRLAREIGDEVKVCPCQTIVPLYRKHVFAEIKPASNKRIELGLALQDEPFTARLADTGGKAKKQRLTHKVAITSLTDIDLQVRRWLREAYERDA